MKIEHKEKKQIKRGIIEFFSLVAVMLGAFSILYFEVFFRETRISESSLIEYAQETILAVMCVLFYLLALRLREARGGFILMGGFILCLFIREQDAFFDNLLFHGSWFYFALFVAIASIFYSTKRLQTTIHGLGFFLNSKEYGMFITGLAIVLVASRLFGMGYLWREILTNGSAGKVKRVTEEYGELLGYAIMLFAFAQFFLTHFFNRKQN